MSLSGIICLVFGILMLIFSVPMIIGTKGTVRFLMDKTACSDGRWRLTSAIMFALGLGMIISAWHHERLSETFIFCSGWAIVFFNIWGVLIPFFGREWMESQMDDFKSWGARFLGMTYAFWGVVFVCLGRYVS